MNLSFNYFFMLLGAFLFSTTFFVNGVNGPKIFMFIITNAIAYTVLKFLDESNFFETAELKRLPKSIDNNLFMLKDGKHKLSKESTDSGGTGEHVPLK